MFSCYSTEVIQEIPHPLSPLPPRPCRAQPVEPPPYCPLPPPYTPQFDSGRLRRQGQNLSQNEGEGQCLLHESPPPKYAIDGQGENQSHHQGQDQCREQPPGYEAAQEEQCDFCRRLVCWCICLSPNYEEIEAVCNQTTDGTDDNGDDDDS